MTKLITAMDFGPEFIAALKRLGFPDQLISLTLEVPEGNQPIIASCTFYPTADDGELKLANEALVKASKRFALVAIEEDEPAAE